MLTIIICIVKTALFVIVTKISHIKSHSFFRLFYTYIFLQDPLLFGLTITYLKIKINKSAFETKVDNSQVHLPNASPQNNKNGVQWTFFINNFDQFFHSNSFKDLMFSFCIVFPSSWKFACLWKMKTTAGLWIERTTAHKPKKQSHKQLAVAELDTKCVITSESSSSRIERVYHGPVG